jgi:hypothetical protein
MNRRLLAIVFTFAMLICVLVPSARADQDNKAILFSVNAPIEVPGEVLGPGRYELKLQGNGSPVAGIWKADGSQFYGYFETVLVDRSHRGKSRIVLVGSGKNAPKRIEEWFYTGDKTGNKLLYPNSSSVQIARATKTRPDISR